ncbi:MAG: hypothetical protein PF693_04200 [Spirochaetia bacterium]|nr:hypothetical protein [Spirochaetia bacterium]
MLKAASYYGDEPDLMDSKTKVLEQKGKNAHEKNEIITDLIRKTLVSNKSFFSTKVFLYLMGALLVAISFFLWKTQEAHNLSQLEFITTSKAASYSNDADRN